MKEHIDQPDEKKEKTQNDTAARSSVDRKNEDVLNQTPSATDRVKPRSGDGLANEGTNVSYESER